MENDCTQERRKATADQALRQKTYYELNKAKVLARKKTFYQSNKNKIKAKCKTYRDHNIQKERERAKKWYNNNKNKKLTYDKNYCKNRYEKDIEFKLRGNLRRRLRQVIKQNQKSGSSVKDLGCSVEFLKNYLESKFQASMSWDNWSVNGWHIDHIKPLTSFNLNDRNQFLQSCHYTNLQPLWAKDNISKSNKIL